MKILLLRKYVSEKLLAINQFSFQQQVFFKKA